MTQTTMLQMERELLTSWYALPDEKRREALEFVQFLDTKTNGQNKPRKPFRSPIGLCADLKLTIDAEEIDEARREMWSSFPREDF